MLCPDMPCMKKVHRVKYMRRSIGQQPGTKSGRLPEDKLRINRGSTAFKLRVNRSLCSTIGLHWISFVRASEGSLRTAICFTQQILWRAKRKVDPWANRPVGVPFCPAPLRPVASLCAAPPRPARGISGFRILQSVLLLLPRIRFRLRQRLCI